MAENILNLNAPLVYRCNLHRYFSGLSRVYVRAFRGYEQLPAFYLLFSDVGYIEGPVTWQGLMLNIAPADACIALMMRVGMIGEAMLQFPDAYAAITETMQLYTIHTTQTPVQLIAGSVTLLPDLPDELK